MNMRLRNNLHVKIAKNDTVFQKSPGVLAALSPLQTNQKDMIDTESGMQNISVDELSSNDCGSVSSLDITGSDAGGDKLVTVTPPTNAAKSKVINTFSKLQFKNGILDESHLIYKRNFGNKTKLKDKKK